MIWLVVACVLVAGATWALVLALALPQWIALVVTATVLAVILVIFAFRLLQGQRRAASLERELMDQAKRQADQARPERRREIIELQKQMTDAIRTLQRSRLGGKRGRAALYALPWYMMVGPPAAGKTTALERSGLSFSAPGGRQRKMRGVAGTRNCDWWFSEEAILLDTAGRFSTEDNDEAEWLSFLDLIKRHRPKRPIDGVIVALSITDVLSGNRDQVEETARKLRERLNELIARLEMVFPVYVLITKADLIAGFVEFWGDLSDEQRGRVWGATFDPEDEALGEPDRALKDEIDVLRGVVHARALRRLDADANASTRARILQFPVELGAVRGPLAEFVKTLFRPSQYGETPLFRGFYFSSGTQTGTPIDRVLAGGLGDRVQNSQLLGQHTRLEQGGGGNSFFVTELFRRIIFADRHLATRSRGLVRRQLRRQILLGAGALLLTILIVMPAALSYLDNSELVDATRDDVQRSTLPPDTRLATPTALQALDVLLVRLQQLREAAEQVSIRGWWGPYVAADLETALRVRYLERLRAIVDGPLQDQLRASVRAVGDLPELDRQSFETGFEELQLYLMMTDPKRLEPERAASRLASVWSQATRRGALAENSLVPTHMGNHVAALEANPGLAWRQDGVVVTRARGRLVSMPIDAIAYGRLESAAKGAPPIRPDHVFYGTSARFVSARGKVEVPGLYTALGWLQVRSLLDDDSESKAFAPWVLGQSSTVDNPWSATRLQELYYERYVRAWMDFLLGLDVATPTTLRAAIDELGELGKADGPYVRLFRKIAENVQLEYEAPTLLEQAVEMAEEKADELKGARTEEKPPRRISPVERDMHRLLAFGFGDVPPVPGEVQMDLPPSPLTQYLDQLRTTEVALKQIEQSALEPGAEFRAELARGAATVERLLASFSQTESLAMEPLLMNPIRGSQLAVKGAESAQLNERWRTEVWDPYRRMVSNYPFAPGATNQVLLADFGEWFRPTSGTLARYYGELLDARLTRSGTTFRVRSAELKSGFRNDLLACLSDAERITEATFPDGDGLGVSFGVKLQAVGPEVSEITLHIDGQSLIYRNEPERWQTMQWPGKDGPRGASVQIKGNDFKDAIRRSGDFGLFQLLQAGGVKPISRGSVVLEASWGLNLGKSNVVIQFRPLTSRHPFRPGLFKLDCPPAILAPRAEHR